MFKKESNTILFQSPWDNLNKRDNIFSDRKKKFLHILNNNQFNFNLNILFIALAGLLFLWLASGIYEVHEGEEAAVIRFGKYSRRGVAGLNYHLPSPIEQVIIEKVNQSRRIEIGYRSGNNKHLMDSQRLLNNESTMLTGDENIIDLNCDIMWHIENLQHYIFNVYRPEEVVKSAAESAIREIIGNTPISSILSDQKQAITEKIEKLTQSILEQYSAGVIIEQVQLLKAEPPAEVIDAYRDVQTAKADKEREINQAQAYNNDILPKARGEAAKIVQAAEGYRQEVTSKAEGDSKRFLAIYQQYSLNKQITRDRLYLSTMEEILTGANKTVMTNGVMLPHMAIQSNNK